MTIYWDSLPKGSKKLLESLLKRALEYTGLPNDAEVSVSFVSREEMQEINLEHRDIDEPTDVLAFPFEDWDDPSGPDLPALALGDIIICEDIAREQAEEYGHSFERELGFLAVHGMLHLAGHDHMVPEDEEKMRAAQREILGELK